MDTGSIPYSGELSALLTAVLWAGTSFLFAEVTRRIGSVLINISRLILAFGFLIATIAIAGLEIRVSQSQVVYLLISGMIGLAFGDTFLYRAYREIGPRLSMLMMSLAPAIAAVCAFVVLGETLPVLGIAGIITTLAGIAIVVIEKREAVVVRHRMTLKGLLYGFFSACGQAGGLLFAKQAFNEGPINGFVAASIRMSVSIAALLVFGLLTRQIKHPVETFRREPKTFTLIVYGTLLGPYLGITFSLYAVMHTEVGIAATLMATVPIIMLPISRFVQNEHLNWKSVLGACTAVGGVALIFLH